MSAPEREFLMQAGEYSPQHDAVGGWYLSEKLRGVRAFWDGGISRGSRVNCVPYARRMFGEALTGMATGLWSNDALPIYAPDYFLNQLPCILLDGVLITEKHPVETLKAVCEPKTPVKGSTPSSVWKDVSYAVTALPTFTAMFKTGLVSSTRPRFNLVRGRVDTWIASLDKSVWEDFRRFTTDSGEVNFDIELKTLQEALLWSDSLHLHKQRRLPIHVPEAADLVKKLHNEIRDAGGRGTMLRNSVSYWKPHFCADLLSREREI